jgi:DnaK suppressor protein
MTKKSKATVRRKPAKKTKVAAKRKPTRKTKVAAKRKPAKKTKVAAKKKPARKTKVAAKRKPARKTKVAAKKKPAKKVRQLHSKSRIAELRAMLEAKRVEILQEIKRAREDSVDTNRTSFAEVGDLVSASVEKERAFEYGEAGVNALREIDSALEKLKSGTYGICELCTKVISVKRLQIMPSARLCIRCKSAEEASGGNPHGR